MGKDTATLPLPGTDEFNALPQEEQDKITAAIAAQKVADDAVAIATAGATPTAVVPEPPASNAKYEVHFPQCNIPGMGFYTKEQLLADPDACAYLVEMGSPVVTEVSPDTNK